MQNQHMLRSLEKRIKPTNSRIIENAKSIVVQFNLACAINSDQVQGIYLNDRNMTATSNCG